jgi:hypothetical protein
MQARNGAKISTGLIHWSRGAPARGGAIRSMLNFLVRTGFEPGQPYGQSGPGAVTYFNRLKY